MVCKDTIKIKNLPKEMSEAQKTDFARHFGASKIKVITSRVKDKSVVYAKFDNEELAKNVLFRLHQINVLNCRLCVEYAENDILQGKPKLKKIEGSDVGNQKYLKTFVNKLTAFNDTLGFNQPPPSHLKYLYPKANRATINNIAHALATIPRFYTQVLHLMNKMNLPPPFAVEQLPVRTITPHHPVMQRPIEKPTVQLPTPVEPPRIEPKPPESSSESELESDDGDYFRNREYVPVKRKVAQKKVVKRPKFMKPLVMPTPSVSRVPESTENVFEKVAVQTQKKIELKVSSDTLEPNRSVPRPEKTGTIGILPSTSKPAVVEKEPAETPKQPPEEKLQEFPAITADELAGNQIPHKDLGVLPVFKNYHPGASTCRLYIKNCAKSVVIGDLEYIYNRYRVPQGETPSQFDIRLMQEGRMKGQAFVTLDSVELAQKAVKETNGYILKDKPLVVVFARSAAQKN